MKDIKKILVRAPNWIGDCVLSLPALKALREYYKDAEIIILARPWVADVFYGSPFLTRVMLYDDKDIHRGIKGFFRLIKELKRKRFDLAVLFQNAFRAALIAMFAGIPLRLGYRRDGRGMLLSKGLRPFYEKERKEHHIYYYMNLLAPLGIVNFKRFQVPRIYLKEEEVTKAERYLKGLSAPVIGINPGAAYGDAKMWGADKFSRLAKKLISEVEAGIIIFGSKQEHQIGEDIAVHINSSSILNMMGRISLRESMALMSRCRLFVTNDTGPMHVASALGVPTLAVFGSTDPEITGPVGEDAHTIKREVDCAPCFKRNCPTDKRCMEAIGVEDVFQMSLQLLYEDKTVIKEGL